jgi:hypothetical protein
VSSTPNTAGSRAVLRPASRSFDHRPPPFSGRVTIRQLPHKPSHRLRKQRDSALVCFLPSNRLLRPSLGLGRRMTGFHQTGNEESRFDECSAPRSPRPINEPRALVGNQDIELMPVCVQEAGTREVLSVSGIVEQATPPPLGREHRNRRTRHMREPVQQRENLGKVPGTGGIVGVPALFDRLKGEKVPSSQLLMPEQAWAHLGHKRRYCRFPALVDDARVTLRQALEEHRTGLGVQDGGNGAVRARRDGLGASDRARAFLNGPAH